MNATSRRDAGKSLSDMEFLAHLNVSLATNHNYRANIEEALGLIGRRFRYDRIHVIKVFPDRSFIILHEWCADCIPAMKKRTRKTPCFFDDGLQRQLNENAYIRIDDLEQLANAELKGFCKRHSTCRALFLPLLLRNFFAFLSFSLCRARECWSEEEIRLMTLFSSVIAGHMEKNLLIARLAQKKQN